MNRVAAVDLGTNSTRLLVADVDGDRLEELTRRLTITRLGEGVDRRRRLLPLPIARVRNCLSEYRQELEALGAERTLCIATSSVRDAENGEAFLGEIEWSYGFTTRLLSGAEEAAMMIRGVTAGRPPLDDVLVVDIGGGSTELVAGAAGEVASATSLDIGCVRITERFLGLGPAFAAPSSRGRAGMCARCFRRSRRRARSASPEPSRPSRRSTSEMPNTTRSELMATVSRSRRSRNNSSVSAAMTTEERLAIPGLEPGRASVIVAGVIVLREVLTAYGLAEIEVSERDVLDGAAFAAAELPEPEEGRRLQAPTPAAEPRPRVGVARRPPRPRRADVAGRCARARRRGGADRPPPGRARRPRSRESGTPPRAARRGRW